MFRVPVLRTAAATAAVSMLPALPEAAPEIRRRRLRHRSSGNSSPPTSTRTWESPRCRVNTREEPAAGGTVQDYYTWISGVIRQGPANPDGSAKLVIGNPGNVSEPQGDWAVARPAGARPVVDILVVFEGFAKDYKTWPQPAWVYPGTDRTHAYRFAHLVHDVREFPFSQERAMTELSRKHHAGYVYVTTEVTGTHATDNPHTDNVLWNQLAPSWFSRTEPAPRVG